MRKFFLTIIFSSASIILFAQDKIANNDESSGHGFDKANLFTGGDLTLSFGTYEGIVGINPFIGYSINKWLDAGVSFNYDYSWQQIYDYTGINLLYTDRETVIGPGAFARVYPVDFLYLQAQYEENFIHDKAVYPNGAPSEIFNYTAPSLLLGVGYAGGREGSRSLFYYISVSIDVLGNVNSPYLQQNYTPSGITTTILPIIRGGIQVPLFQDKPGRY